MGSEFNAHWINSVRSELAYCIGLDNGNIGFLLLIGILFPLIFWIARIESNTMNFTLLFFLLFFLLVISFLLVSLLLFFVFYECLIILLFFILFLFLPSFYRIRTTFIFFIFTIFGTISFILSLMIFILSEWWISSLMILIPFCVKIPCFPFYYWLPEVHCEANSSISLLLAGLLLKLGIFGIIRFILSSFFLPLRFLSSFVLSISLIGIILASCSSFRYYDLKKMIAFSSIIHLNLAFCSLMCMNACGIIASIISSISHSLSSSSLFMYAGVLINKVYTRYYESFFFLSQIMRTLLLFVMLTNLGFAMTLNFVGEMFALIGLFSIDSLWLVCYWLSCFLSTFYWFTILNRKLPYYLVYFSLNYIELMILSWLLIINYFSGVGFLIFINLTSTQTKV